MDGPRYSDSQSADEILPDNGAIVNLPDGEFRSTTGGQDGVRMSLISELKRRTVFRMAADYLAVSAMTILPCLQ